MAKAERAAIPDARTSCIYARRALESMVRWAYDHDRDLVRPYDSKLDTLLHEPSFKRLVGGDLLAMADRVRRTGNRAVHETGEPHPREVVACLSALFELTYWFARTYSRGPKPAADLRFDIRAVPRPVPSSASVAAEAARLRDELAASEAAREAAEAQLAEQATRADRAALAASATEREVPEAELVQARPEVAEAKAAALAQPDHHDYSEAETRDQFVDDLLHEAGWALAETRDREFPVTGMPLGSGDGRVDYVLWDDEGRPLGIVEAKRTKKEARAGQQQAKLYADRLEERFGRRPVIFCSNGYEHWIWDDVGVDLTDGYAPRRIQGFFANGDLEVLVQRRSTRRRLSDTPVDKAIVERYYQERAIRRIDDAFEADRERRALLVMATGAGKTRTVVALADQLIRAGWAKRILFLADRTALVRQATNAFKAHLPDSSPVNLVDDRTGEGRVYVSTYQTMMGLVSGPRGEARRFGVGHFDLVVIDEAHRSVYRKFGAIFDHFDSLLVGLTATPADEIDRNTYRLFHLESGVPTDAYPLTEAVADGFLVPYEGSAVGTSFMSQGVRYADLSEDEKDDWDALEWDGDDPDPPDAVSAEAVNAWLFNADTVDLVLRDLMTNGIKVAGGDRLGKTIIFAKSQRHADFVAERFDVSFPQHSGTFARTITHQQGPYAQTLITDFEKPDSAPHIAISVDMLDTGIDVPEVVNLVFFKPVRSRTKFWQMIGRGTRLRPDLFGPGEDKTHFKIFDHCRNFEFFAQDPATSDRPIPPSLGARLFVSRLDLLGQLAASQLDAHPSDAALRRSTADVLWRGVAAINLDNVVARPHRRIVERYADRGRWDQLDLAEATALAEEVAELPDQLPAEAEEARRFDLLVLNLQLALLRGDAGFERLRQVVVEIAGLLEEYPAIPAVAAEAALLAEVQTAEWWEAVTVSALEDLRTRVRGLVGFIERRKRKVVFTDFADALAEAVPFSFSGTVPAESFAQFRKKATAFLREHQGELAVEKIRRNWAITADDMADLQRILVAAGVGTDEHCQEARRQAGSFGLFVRSLVGLDRSAAKDAFSAFLDDRRYNAAQIQFVTMIIDDLTQHGVIDPGRFYQSPFVDVAPVGPSALFTEADVHRLFETAAAVRTTAEVA